MPDAACSHEPKLPQQTAWICPLYTTGSALFGAQEGTNHCIQVSASRSSIGFTAHCASRNAPERQWFISWGSCHLPHHSHVPLPAPARQPSPLKPRRLKLTFSCLPEVIFFSPDHFRWEAYTVGQFKAFWVIHKNRRKKCSMGYSYPSQSICQIHDFKHACQLQPPLSNAAWLPRCIWDCRCVESASHRYFFKYRYTREPWIQSGLWSYTLSLSFCTDHFTWKFSEQ